MMVEDFALQVGGHQVGRIVGGEGALLAAETRKCFLEWCDNREVKPEEVFWKMAAGKTFSSPFESVMPVFRERIDKFLEERGHSPRRRSSDVQCEIQFRRMQAMLAMMGDEDHSYLLELVEKGVRIGVDVELPRVPEVFEAKTKWNVEATEEELHEVRADNYDSAEENAEDIKRQVLEEVDLGTILKVPLRDAQEEYGDRLAIASLGAVNKEVGSSKVRVVHDGTYSVDINRRIRVRDRLRFPLLDDAGAILGEVREECEGGRGGIRFSMLYDVARAHKLIPVDRQDWGLQAFRLPGGSKEEVYLHTRGTFGVASAAYWWGRCAAGAIRLLHRLSGRELALYHLLYADDGWLVATGGRFWQRILFWMFCLDLLEIPVSWKKVKGGTEADWIGYHLDVRRYERGISSKKQQWVMNWIETKLKDGGIVGRELRSVLGRLSFVAGALRQVRPFLAPMFAWSSSLAPGTYAAWPDALKILLRYVKDEISRKPMREAKKLQDTSVEGFRIDAKAQQDDIVIGGWETYEGVDTKKRDGSQSG